MVYKRIYLKLLLFSHLMIHYYKLQLYRIDGFSYCKTYIQEWDIITFEYFMCDNNKFGY